MGKDSGGNWRVIKISSSGALSNGDAGNFRVSSIGGSSSPLSADSSSISAKQGDAGLLRMSAIISTTPNVGAIQLTSPWVTQGTTTLSDDGTIDRFFGRVSAIQQDASLFRVSSIDALDTTNNVKKVEQQFSYYYVSATGIFTIKNAPTLLHAIVINKRGTGSTMGVYDNTSAASGLTVGIIDTTLSTTAFIYDAKMTTGLTVSTAGAGAADMTVIYR